MKSKGIVRKIDELGRVVIPKEMREAHGFERETPVEIISEENHVIIRRSTNLCIFCDAEEELTEFKGKKLCPECISKIKGEL